MKTLERMKFTQVDESPVDDREQLAREAQDVLGYHKLAQVIFSPGPLFAALRALEIEPLMKRSVDAYKAKKARPGMWSGHRKGYIKIAVGFPLLALVCAFAMRISWANPFPFAMPSVFAIIGMLALTIIGFVQRFDSAFSGNRIIREWKLVSLAGYEGSVPEFVLSKALQIKGEVPQADLYVDQLFESEELLLRRAPDPFLVVKMGPEKYYIEVWDEKEYEAKL